MVIQVSSYVGIKTGIENRIKSGNEIVGKVGRKTRSKTSVLAFLKCMDGSLLAFLKCMDGSLLVSLKCMDGSYWPTSGFPSNLPPLDFPNVPKKLPEDKVCLKPIFKKNISNNQAYRIH